MTEKKKLLWHSNSPWAPTGYGAQTALFAPILDDHYDLTLSAFYGLEGSPIRWEGVRVLPGLGGEFGNDTLTAHARHTFGDLRDGIVMTLCDVWVLDPDMARQLNFCCWTPIDSVPVPQKAVDFFLKSEAVPIAMSRFGERLLGQLDPLYVPHAVNCADFKRRDPAARQRAFPEGAFVVGMVAANKGRPSRKGFAQALSAFALFAQENPESNPFLYLHTTLDPNYGNGENLTALIRELGIPDDRVRVGDQYALMHAPYSAQEMAQIYSSLDVLLNPSFGEGFGIPIVEAQACETPVIVTDFSAMPELCGAGWTVKYQPYWTGLNTWQAIPNVEDIANSLEECYKLSPARREKLGQTARKHALNYDLQRVAKQFMLPALRQIEQRFADRTPVKIPSRLKAAA